MDIPLTEAPFDKPLTLSRVDREDVDAMLSQVGLFRGQAFTRENEEVLLHPVRVHTSSGDIVLGGLQAMRMIVHLDDGRKMPLLEMLPGQTGHIEGATCPNRIMETLSVLGLSADDPITFLRQLPPMDYTALVDRKKRVRINEGMAAKIWGRVGERRLQFVSAGKGQPFIVEKILGGFRAGQALEEKGIAPGKTISLETVAPAQTFSTTSREPVVITTEAGLHLHLPPGQAQHIYVKPAEPE
jgi:Fe2+ transport system protein FeoA